jgi:hypothetical protein
MLSEAARAVPADTAASPHSWPRRAATATGALPILTYHSLDTSGAVVSVPPREFAAQMRCVADLGFRGISLREALEHRERHRVWPARAVVLTFDDGYANVHEHALPVLLQRRFTATFFLISGYLESPPGRPAASPGAAGPWLSWREAAELAAAGMEIGGHTSTHADLARLSPADAEAEIVASRRELERRLHISVDSFAYPFGHVSSTALAIVERQFRAACTTVLKRVAKEEAHLLPRIDMYYVRSCERLAQLLAGRLDRYLTMRRWGRHARRLLVSDARGH